MKTYKLRKIVSKTRKINKGGAVIRKKYKPAGMTRPVKPAQPSRFQRLKTSASTGARKFGTSAATGARKLGSATATGARKLGTSARKLGSATATSARALGTGARKLGSATATGARALGTGAKKFGNLFRRKDSTGRPNPNKQGTKKYMDKRQENEKASLAKSHKKESDDMDARHKREMDNETDPVKRDALKKKQDDEKGELNKRHNSEKDDLRKRHNDEQDDFRKSSGPGGPGGPPQLSLGAPGGLSLSGPGGIGMPSVPGMPGFPGAGNMFGPQDFDENGRLIGDGTGGLGTGPNGEDCMRISPDGICTLEDGTQILPDGSTILPDGTRILPDGTEEPPGGVGARGYGTNIGDGYYGSTVSSDVLQGEIVPGVPIEIKDSTYTGPRDRPFQYKIPFEKDGITGMLKTQFMIRNPRGYKYYLVYGQSIEDIENTIKKFAMIVKSQDSPRGDYITSLKTLSAKLKSEIESTEATVDVLENNFDDIETEDRDKAADTLKLMQARLEGLVQQLAGVERIRSRGFK
jgi:hypothetical protein